VWGEGTPASGLANVNLLGSQASPRAARSASSTSRRFLAANKPAGVSQLGLTPAVWWSPKKTVTTAPRTLDGSEYEGKQQEDSRTRGDTPEDCRCSWSFVSTSAMAISTTIPSSSAAASIARVRATAGDTGYGGRGEAMPHWIGSRLRVRGPCTLAR